MLMTLLVLDNDRQAVNSGMASPCIMCLSLPQGDIDHFCSRLCREEALSKPT
jgi:hypothetical protein